MRRFKLLFVLLGFGFAGAGLFFLWNSEVDAVVGNAKEVTLYSLHPNNRLPEWQSEDHPPEESFHAFQILGSVKLTAEDEVREVTGALRQGLAEWESPHKCFWPRHGLRFERRGHTYDFVICFQCRQVYVYRDGEEMKRLTTGVAPQQAFNDILSKHNVVLPPPEE